MGNLTIKQIALLAGVSTATVSNVLNENGRFSEETKYRVMEVVNKYQYRTNVVAKSLRTNQSKTIGVIVPDIANEFFANIVIAIEDYLVPNGYSIFICNSSEDNEKEKLFVRDLEAKGVDGLIYVSGNLSITDEAIKKRLPIVSINRRYQRNDEIFEVQSDNYRGGFIAAEELLKQGCKRIVILKDDRSIVPMQERYRGYCDAHSKHSLNIEPSLVLGIPVDVNNATQVIQELLDQKIPFDGIFACTDWLAIGAMKALRDNGVKIPEEIKVVGFDNILFGQHSYPTLTTIEQNQRKLGETAAEILLKIIEERTYPQQRKVIVPVSLINRNSTF